MIQNLAGGIIALPRAGHRHAVCGVGAAVKRGLELPAELTDYAQGEVGFLLSSCLTDAVDALLRSAGEGGWFPVGAVVLVVTVNAVSRQTITEAATWTLCHVAFFI